MKILDKISILNMFFKNQVKPGDYYAHRDNYSDPFNRDRYTVVVLEVKEGWVKFSYPRYEWASSETLNIRSFNFCYRKLESPPKRACGRGTNEV